MHAYLCACVPASSELCGVPFCIPLPPSAHPARLCVPFSLPNPTRRRGEDVPLDDCKELIGAIDSDGDGVVDFSEFCDICQGKYIV